jgi:O-methyltransferase
MLKRLIANTARSFGYSILKTETLDRLQAHPQRDRNELTPHRAPDIAVPRGAPLEPLAQDSSLSAEHFFRAGEVARRRRDDAVSFVNFAKAISLIPRYEPARDALIEMSNECFSKAAAQEGPEKLALLVKALEMNPVNSVVRADLVKFLQERQGGPDLTQMCFVFYDGERARRIHEEAYKRALEFVTIGGIPGAVMEFGVLGGWSSRIFCEVMRDIFNLNNIYLFDSFEGLPEYDSAVDRESYEIGGRNVWSDKMKFPAEFLKQFGQPHQWHIRDRLSEVIRPERIFIRQGFYSETLKSPPKEKASVVHLDCDLYQSTVEVLEGLYRGDCLQDGTVLLFDDWNCNKANPNFGERRAFREFLEGQSDFIATPWFTYGWCGAAYIIHVN